VKAHRNY